MADQDVLTRLLRRQCWLFVIGSAFFAVATAPGFTVLAGSTATNGLCCVGSWFFTSAAAVQWRLTPRSAFDYAASFSQFLGTLYFNVSTFAAVVTHLVSDERQYVWTPDAVGSALFLVSSIFAVCSARAETGRTALLGGPWPATWVNLVGSVAFGVAGVAAYIRPTGATEDEVLANAGTFVGAVCFLVAALMVLPTESPRGRRFRASPS